MIVLREFTFEGDAFYKDLTTISLGTPSMTLLCGKNLDGGEKVSNGAGKTRLLQILQAFIYGSSDRGHLKKMAPAFKGSLEFLNTKTNDVWRFAADVKENEWLAECNGVEYLKDHRPSEYQALLQRQIGLDKKEWTHFVSVNRRSVAILLEGTPTMRKQYLESFFNIDKFYDEKKKEYETTLASLTGKLSLLQTAQAKLEQVQQTLDSLPNLGYLDLQLAAIDGAVVVLKATLSKADLQADTTRADLASWATYRDAHAAVQGKEERKVLEERLKRVRERHAELRAKETEQASLQRHVLKVLEPAKAALKDDPVAPEVDDPDVDAVTQLELLVVQMNDKVTKRQKLKLKKAELDAIEVLPFTLEQVGDQIAEALLRKAELDKTIKLIETDGDICSNCGQTLPHSHEGETAEQKLSALRSELKDVASSLVETRACKKTLETRATAEVEVNRLQREFDGLPVFGRKLGEVAADLSQIKSLSAQWRSYRAARKASEKCRQDYERALAEANAKGYPEALDVDYAPQIAAVAAEIGTDQDDLDVVITHDKAVASVLRLLPQSRLERDLQHLEAERDWATLGVERLNEMRGEYRSQSKVVTEQRAAESKLLDQLVDRPQLEREYRIVEACVKFYGPRGFKVYELKQRCEALIERTNYWSGLFFQEPYEWSLDPDDDGLEFLVRPSKHRSVEPYPANLLSAGEENRATRALLFAQLELIPPNKNVNCLFLDEIESNLDSVGLTAFVETVLPKLRETFSDKSIVVVSHHESLKNSVAIDNLWVAERKNRKTKLKVVTDQNRRFENLEETR